ncbi:hypothetical protein A3F66_03290 [candidate division TM6 bacterium RIFCSPHIGHO2_12_FULL_32_22]|nr:MAG: hypothetical protein A3F66_03290 [candidate division TM6 bacterium RIFCSPHIGHO2_12_FULL_32_22]
MKIYVSLLNADKLSLEQEIKKLEPYCDGFHIDVMDFHFVENLAFGISTVNEILELTTKQIWLHLMVDNPAKYLHLNLFKLRRNDIFSFHLETTHNKTVELISEIEEKGLISNLYVNPESDINMIKPYTVEIDQITLVATRNPEFSEKKFVEHVFLDATYDKLENLIKNKKEHNLKYTIAIDGGINLDNIQKLQSLGATEFVIGSALFESKDPVEFLKEIKKR